jgi:hypothetical protein
MRHRFAGLFSTSSNKEVRTLRERRILVIERRRLPRTKVANILTEDAGADCTVENLKAHPATG